MGEVRPFRKVRRKHDVCNRRNHNGSMVRMAALKQSVGYSDRAGGDDVPGKQDKPDKRKGLYFVLLH